MAAMTGFRAGLLKEILVMAVDTLRANKLRSALTILGVVIGITSIVSMTALIRGFDESFKDLFRQIGPTTMYVTKFSFVNISGNKEFRDLVRRPNLTGEDARAIERSPLIQTVAMQVGGGFGSQPERLTYASRATKRMGVLGVSANWNTTHSIPLAARPHLQRDRSRSPTPRDHPRPRPGGGAVPRRPTRSASGCAPARPIHRGRRAAASGRTRWAASEADEFAIVPWTTWQKIYGADALRIFGIVHRDVNIVVDPARGRRPRRRDARGRGDHAGAARPAPRPGERLRHRHPGDVPAASGTA